MNFTDLAREVTVEEIAPPVDADSLYRGFARNGEATVRFSLNMEVVQDNPRLRDLSRARPSIVDTHEISISGMDLTFVLISVTIDSARMVMDFVGRVVGRRIAGPFSRHVWEVGPVDFAISTEATITAASNTTRPVAEPSFHAPWGKVRRALNV